MARPKKVKPADTQVTTPEPQQTAAGENAAQLPAAETPKAPKTKVVREFKKELIATLEKCPHIDCVYMNDAGEWHFAEKAGFTPCSREEILKA